MERGGSGLASATTSASWQQRQQRAADRIADRELFDRCVQSHPLNQTGRQLYRECQLRFGHGHRFLQPMCLLKVAICLSWRDGAVFGQALDGLWKLLEPPKQIPRVVESFGFWSVAGATHMS